MGEAKNYHSIARAKFRGLDKVEIQFILTAAVLNLKKMEALLKKKDIEKAADDLKIKVLGLKGPLEEYGTELRRFADELLK